MNRAVIYKWCNRCDDIFYNEADMASIVATRKCVNCAKEVKFRKELVAIAKKKKLLYNKNI